MSRNSYDAQHLNVLAQVEQKHFWFGRRRDKICEVFQRYVPKSARILEVGGGTGFVAAKLQEFGFSIEMADVHTTGFDYARQRGIAQLHQFDLFDAPFDGEFDVVCLFDVLEHLGDPVKAMECLKRMLRPGGMIILTVPAHEWLWSRDDVIAGHECRYNRRQLMRVMESAQLQCVQVRYFFSTLIPLLLLRRWMKGDDGSPLQQGEVFEVKISPFANGVLGAMTQLEFCFDRVLPNLMGGSLIAVAVS